MGPLLLSSGSWGTEGFVGVHQESVSPALCSSVIKSHWPPVSNSLGVPNERYQGNISCKMGTIKDRNDMNLTHLEPDILECEVKWALGIITTSKASGGDGIPVELLM